MNEPFAALILAAATLCRAATCSTWAAAAAARRSPPPGSSRPARRSASTSPVRCWPGPGPAPKRPACGNAVFQQGDAQVHPLGPARFDAVISRFGIDVLRRPGRRLREHPVRDPPGGRLAFVCWQPLAANQWLLVPGAALAEHVPLPAGLRVR